jgi:mannose-6-phosphate isomerase-like protein (cupin superfamily)
MIRSTQSTEHYTWGKDCDGWHLVRDGKLSVIYERMPPGASEMRHCHNQAQQFFFVLEGVAVLEVEGKEFTLNKHEGVHVAAGKRHQMFNRSDADLVFLVISQPPSHGDRVNAASETR